jgi:LmbE family N-acetylglucosaminyl deacetylase
VTPDVFVSPHSDDICFSLGAFVRKRRAGILLTVFSNSAYLAPRPGRGPVSSDVATRTRMSEDRAFAAACNLEARFLELGCASFYGKPPFDLAGAGEKAAHTEAPLMQALLALAAAADAAARPWLFCPAGIGGHVDHVATLIVVGRNLDRIKCLYRLAFYEDLYYASDARARSAGLERLSRELPGCSLKRYAYPLGDGGTEKLKLLHFYPSQFEALPQSIERFTPADGSAVTPHEAIWTEDESGPA